MTPERWRERFPKWVAQLGARLHQGHKEYGDESFERSEDELDKEIQQELADVSNWAFIQWDKIQGRREKRRKREAGGG